MPILFRVHFYCDFYHVYVVSLRHCFPLIQKGEECSCAGNHNDLLRRGATGRQLQVLLAPGRRPFKRRGHRSARPLSARSTTVLFNNPRIKARSRHPDFVVSYATTRSHTGGHALPHWWQPVSASSHADSSTRRSKSTFSALLSSIFTQVEGTYATRAWSTRHLRRGSKHPDSFLQFCRWRPISHTCVVNATLASWKAVLTTSSHSRYTSEYIPFL